jgi:GDP-D-mannose dehydratase
VQSLVTGANGQDGQILTKLLSERGFKVSKVVARHSKCENLKDRDHERTFSLESIDFPQILRIVRPEIIVHSAGLHQSSELNSDSNQYRTKMKRVHVNMTKEIIDYQKSVNLDCKSVISLSAHMFAPVTLPNKINEESQTSPLSYYGETKLEAWSCLKNARNDGLNISGAILFNHTSALSKDFFLFPRIAQQLVQILFERKNKLEVQNLSIKLDISDAHEIANGILNILEMNQLEDFVLGSNSYFEIWEVVKEVCTDLGIDWEKVLPTKLSSSKTGYFGDANKAKNKLGWQTQKSPRALLLEMTQQLIQ